MTQSGETPRDLRPLIGPVIAFSVLLHVVLLVVFVAILMALAQGKMPTAGEIGVLGWSFLFLATPTVLIWAAVLADGAANGIARGPWRHMLTTLGCAVAGLVASQIIFLVYIAASFQGTNDIFRFAELAQIMAFGSSVIVVTLLVLITPILWWLAPRLGFGALMLRPAPTGSQGFGLETGAGAGE